MAGNFNSITINFDTGIEKIEFNYGSAEHTFLTSGETYVFYEEPGSSKVLTVTLTATLKAGYNIDTTSLGTINGNVINVGPPIDNMKVTITSKQGGGVAIK